MDSVNGMNFMMEFLTQNWNTLLGVFAATISVLGAVFSRIDARARKHSAQEQIRQTVIADCRAWGEKVIDTIGEGAALASMGAMDTLEFLDQRERCATKLSSLIDRGRLFFPNLPKDKSSDGKEGAYQGQRPPILDAIVYAYYEVESLEPPTNLHSRVYIVKCRRFFVSELQNYLDPHRLNAILTRGDPKHLGDASMQMAGELGIILNLRRPGILTQKSDTGWIDSVSPERRTELLKEYGGDQLPADETNLDQQNET